MHKVVYTYNSRDDLKELPSSVEKRIVKKIHFYSVQKDPLHFAKRLKIPEIGSYRFRIGEYRALFDIDRKGAIYILMILRIKHRKDNYNL